MKGIKNTTGVRIIPPIDLSAQYRTIKPEVDKSISRVLNSGRFILGSEVENFEKDLAKYIGTKYAVGLACGTDALTLSLKAIGIKEGDGVVLATNVYPTAFGLALTGARLQLADIDPKTLNLSAETAKKAINKKTKAIVAVHLYGNPADLTSLKKLARQKGLYLIEDCAQAHGAHYRGQKVGTFGDISCFSFYPTKNLGAYGDGGAIVTKNANLAQKVKLLRMYGEKTRYQSVLVGHNSRLDELQAAILDVKLKYLDAWNKRRRELVAIYRKELKGVPIRIVEETPKAKSVYHLFVVMVEERDKLAEYLFKKGIITGIHYPIPIHLVPSFSFLGYKKGDFPVSEEASQKVLSLPLYPEMTENQVRSVTKAIKSFYAKR